MEWLWQALVWLQASPTRFWLLAWTAFAWVFWLAFRAPHERGQPTGRFSSLWFALAVTAMLAVFRWPSWFVPEEFNPDESQVIAGALTLAQFPVYWRHLDGTTHGPLCEYPLILASWLGAPFNYVTARIIATLMQALSLLSIWGLLRPLTTERVARLAVLPGLAFWSFVTWHDFVHYSTELPAILCLALAGWALSSALHRPTGSRSGQILLFLTGLCLGAVPFAKLQAVPIALCLTGIALVLVWRLGTLPYPQRLLRIAWLVAGGLMPLLITAIFLTVLSEWPAFWNAYILGNTSYTGLGHHPFREMPGWFFNFASTSLAFAWFISGSLAFIFLYSRHHGERPQSLWIATLLGWLCLASAYYAVISPSREVAHYLHLLVVPLTTLVGLVMAAALAEIRQQPARSPYAVFVWFIILTILPQVYDRAVTYHAYLHAPAQLQLPRDEATAYLIAHAGPHDTMAMWGWEPSFHVLTGLPHGTRDPHTSHQITNWPMQTYFITRYTHDLATRKPAWYVDAVGPGAFIYERRESFAHENFGSLREFIQEHYDFQVEFGNKRIYRLKNP